MIKQTDIILPFGKINIYCDEKNCPDKWPVLSGNYKNFFSHNVYDVFFVRKKYQDNTYRNRQVQQGHYLGHNFGMPASIRVNEKSIFVGIEEGFCDYRKIFWSYIIKYIFTVEALKNNILHIKAMAVKDKKDRIHLFLGRMGSGKTNILQFFEKKGFKAISNTHCFVDDNHIWGVNTWRRVRDSNNNDYYFFPSRKNNLLEGEIFKIYILCTELDDKTIELNVPQKKAFIQYFSSAITNYDLKEDIFEFQIGDKMRLFAIENKLIEQFAMKKILVTSYDSQNKKNIIRFEKYFYD